MYYISVQIVKIRHQKYLRGYVKVLCYLLQWVWYRRAPRPRTGSVDRAAPAPRPRYSLQTPLPVNYTFFPCWVITNRHFLGHCQSLLYMTRNHCQSVNGHITRYYYYSESPQGIINASARHDTDFPLYWSSVLPGVPSTNHLYYTFTTFVLG